MPGNSFVINRIVRKLSYAPLSFEPICVLVRAAHVVTVNSASPYRTLGDYLAAARAQPVHSRASACGIAAFLPI